MCLGYALGLWEARLQCPKGRANKATPETTGRPGVRGFGALVDPVIPRPVASPQSLTTLLWTTLF